MGDAGADKHCGIDRSYEEPMPMPLTSRAAQSKSQELLKVWLVPNVESPLSRFSTGSKGS